MCDHARGRNPRFQHVRPNSFVAFSIQGARIVNFDRNLNRRLTQTVITAVVQMQFFAGDLR